VVDAAAVAFSKPGLWGIGFGNGAGNQPRTTLFYAAGTNNELNGIYGRIDLGGAPVLNAPPVVAITAPTTQGVTGTVAVTATATAQVNIARVQFYANGTLVGTATTSPYTVQWDSTTSANATAVALTATATDVDGNVGTSPTVSVTVGTMTLASLQAAIFTTKCAVCHNGVGTVLPGVQNLSDGATFNSVVGVTSLEVATLKRVLAGDANNSYLIQKLEGTAASGVRMPLGGPYLDQPTINQVRTWINNGAPNN
jgi:mono/diheme cytochrome c family protein